MKTSGYKTKILLAAVAMTASYGVSAAALTSVSIAGNYIVWTENPGGLLLPLPMAPEPNISNALGGNAAAPGGNIELSKFGGPVTTLSGVAGGHRVTLSSLTLADWTGNSNALATRYIQDAAIKTFGAPLGSTNLNIALNNFFNVDIDPTASVRYMWQLVSDPNISYVDVTSNILSVGLAGLFNATAFLNTLSAGTGAPVLTGTHQVSEVVKVSLDDSDPAYLYGFTATPSLVHARDGVSYTGNYDVTLVPEPTSLALLGISFFGLLAARRRGDFRLGCSS